MAQINIFMHTEYSQRTKIVFPEWEPAESPKFFWMTDSDGSQVTIHVDAGGLELLAYAVDRCKQQAFRAYQMNQPAEAADVNQDSRLPVRLLDKPATR